MQLLGINVTDEEFDFFVGEEAKGKELYIKNGKIASRTPAVTDDYLRSKRNSECFPIINRGELWYDSLTQEQRIELSVWYRAWLDVTETKVVPTKPSWLE